MNPIFDTALLKHHRIDYGQRIERAGPRHKTVHLRPVALALTALVGLNIAAQAFNLAG